MLHSKPYLILLTQVIICDLLSYGNNNEIGILERDIVSQRYNTGKMYLKLTRSINYFKKSNLGLHWSSQKKFIAISFENSLYD